MATKESGGQEHASRSAEDAAVESAEATEQDASTANVAERKDELDADVDAILDEIDEVTRGERRGVRTRLRAEGRTVIRDGQ